MLHSLKENSTFFVGQQLFGGKDVGFCAAQCVVKNKIRPM